MKKTKIFISSVLKELMNERLAVTDRIVIASPGLLPEPLTLAMVRAFKYRPKSRNPIIARALFDVRLMEERGGGFKRMHDMMVNLNVA